MDKSINEKFSPLQFLIVVLSIYVLISLIVSTFFILPIEIKNVLDYLDNGICIIFLFDFFVRFFKAENKIVFMKWGWIDLISSIPMLDYFRGGRLFRLIRLFRILRGISVY